VRLRTPVGLLVSAPGKRVACTTCGEEIMNERELARPAGPVCRSCAGQSYYSIDG
jgi:formylmethanofuran dehydrogenase subunit E